MTPPDPRTVSFVIANRDDRGVALTLDALLQLDVDPDCDTEILVVDASDGRLDDLRSRFPQVRWIPFRGSGAKPTIAEQRNVGVASSHGEIIVFIDASCVPDPGWLPALLDPVLHDGEALVAGSHRSVGKRGIRDEAMHFVGTGPYVREAPTLNLAVARIVFERVGGFDESFAYGSDIDLTWRAVDAGFRIRYVPDAVVAHDWGDFLAESRRSFRYGQARYRLYTKHARHRRAILREDPPAVVYPVILILSPIALLYPWTAGVLALLLVKNWRHRPVLTVVHHLIYAAGLLTEAWRTNIAPAGKPGLV